MFHIDSAEKRAGLPELGKAQACGRTDCPAPNFEQGFGLAGGGYGSYEYCEACRKVVAKTVVPDDEA